MAKVGAGFVRFAGMSRWLRHIQANHGSQRYQEGQDTENWVTKMTLAPRVALEPELAAAARDLCSEALRADVDAVSAHLVHPREDRDYILRLTLAGPRPLPSVILKCAPRPYRAEAPALREPGGFFHEWVGIEFLSAVSAPVPRFLGGHRKLGFVLMEDLGQGRDLADVLLGADYREADLQLLGMARTLAALHNATAGRRAEYERLWLERAGAASASTPYLGALDTGVSVLADVGCTPNQSAIAEAREVLGAGLAGPFDVYVHGDACPDNFVADELGRLRIIDFEVGGYASALLDAVYPRMQFPTCWCTAATPPPRITAFEDEYRRTLAERLPAAGDDDLFLGALVDACGVWALHTLARRVPPLLDRQPAEEENPWRAYRGAPPRRQVLARLQAFVAVSSAYGRRSALAAVVADCVGRLGRRWRVRPEVTDYPAFLTNP